MTAKPKPVKQPKKKRKVASERHQLEKRLDDLVSAIVILRDGKCVTCGTLDGLTCSHFVKREKKVVRWSLENCNAMCASCNLRHNYYPGAYAMYIEGHYGLEVMHQLYIAETINAYKWSIPDLLNRVIMLTNEFRAQVHAHPEHAAWAYKRIGVSV